MPTVLPTVASVEGNSSSGDDQTVAIFASVGVAMILCVGGYLVYRYRLHVEIEKAKNTRKVEYFRKQQLLAAAMEKEREEMLREIEREQTSNAVSKNKKKIKRPMPGAGAYATGPGQGLPSHSLSPDASHSSSSRSASDDLSHSRSSVYSNDGSLHDSSVSYSCSRSRSGSEHSFTGSSRSSSVESMSASHFPHDSSVLSSAFNINDLFESDSDSEY